MIYTPSDVAVQNDWNSARQLQLIRNNFAIIIISGATQIIQYIRTSNSLLTTHLVRHACARWYYSANRLNNVVGTRGRVGRRTGAVV